MSLTIPNTFVAGPILKAQVNANFAAVKTWADTVAVEKTYVDGLASPSAWTGVTYAANWVNMGGAFQTVQYRKVGDIVYLRGTATKSGSAATVTAFTLPVGFRPPAKITVGSGNITVDSAGVVVAYNGGNGEGSPSPTYFDNIQFSVTA